MKTQQSKKFIRDGVTIEPTNKASAALIMLHGLGADAGDLSQLASHIQSSQNNIRFIFPNAPLMPISLNNGFLMPAWYDILGLTENTEQDEEGIRKAKEHIEVLIHQQNEMGIAYDRIFLGGFSQGGALALFTGLHCREKIGGVIALSTYLPIADKLSPQHQALPIFMGHGSHDAVVPMRWAKIALRILREYGCYVDWHEYQIEHTINEEETKDLHLWLEKRICCI